MVLRKILRSIMLVPIIGSLMISNSLVSYAAAQSVYNGTQFGTIHAHGGNIIKSGSTYYFYGENRDSNNKFVSVACYQSSDLKNWSFVNNVLSTSSASELANCKIERPKVMFNASTNSYVMWMHYENGSDYSLARAAVAYSSTPGGNFTYKGSFRPLDTHMSRDCNVFVDTDGSGYFISAANNNADLNLYKLSSDYRSISSKVVTLFAGQSREAPVLFKKNSTYILLTSGCTGWAPNQAKYSYSSSLSSGWSSLTDIANGTTYDSQPTSVLQVGSSYMYMGDRWAGAWGGTVNSSSYVWLPINFSSDSSLSMNYSDEISVDTSSGVTQSLKSNSFDGMLTDANPYGWVTSAGSGTTSKVGVPSGSSSKALILSDTSSSNLVSNKKSLPSSVSGTVTMQVKFNFANTGKWDRIKLLNGTTSAVEIVNFDKCSDGTAGLGFLKGTTYTKIQSISANTWYTLKVVANTSAQTFDVYINGTLVKSGCAFANSASAITGVEFATGSSYVNTATFDDLTIY